MACEDEPVSMTTFTIMAEMNPSRARLLRATLEEHGFVQVVEHLPPRGPVPQLRIVLTPKGREVGVRLIAIEELLGRR